MASRYLPLAAYSLLLAVVAGAWLARDLAVAHDFPPLWAVAACIGACLFVFQFGLPAPRVGLTSLERLPQIGMLLTLDPPVAAALCAAASLLWPLFNRAYSHGSLEVAALRGVHNAAMTALMLLAGHRAYEATGGRHPLVDLAPQDALPLVALALVTQAVNIAVMALYFRFDRRVVSRMMTPAYVLTDLIFVPAGVLAAVMFNSHAPATFALFAALMVVFVLSFNGIARTLSSPETEVVPPSKPAPARPALHGARRVDELGDRILAEARALFRFDEFYLVLVDRDAQQLDVRVHERRGERLPARRKPLAAGLFGWVVERAEPLLVKDWSRAPAELWRCADVTDKETGSLIAVPLVESGEVIGLLSVQHTRVEVYSDADLHLMQELAEQVAAAMANARAFEDLESYRRALEERVAERTRELEAANLEKERLIGALRERSRALERESQEDPLTGIANRRCFSQRLATEIEVARAVGQPLTLAVADIDHFKIVNDRLGHAVGDDVLRESATLMLQACRGTDLVARIGGEEFALILPGMKHDDAFRFCEALRHAVESHEWQALHPHLRVTLSIGLSQWNGAADAAALLQAADAQLYRAKRTGRNRVA
jgi:diguanylate cyclase (GGDEF)-like protein